MGDSLDKFGLGFMGGAGVTGGLIAVVAILVYTTKISRVVLFWIAFVLTRPFGATSGDLLSKSTEDGGLGIGTVWPSAVLLGIIVIGVVVVMIKQWRQASQQPVLAVEEVTA